ncbi:MAG TPA: xanthine dehydrogenase family protein subunit M [Rhodopila sp.]|nr:xanthine dehydrogenase family protein subunit M [Rhodopila sp.]
MKAPPFDYERAASVEQASALLARHGDDARLIAGGQSLLPALNLRLAAPRLLIDIGRIAGLDHIQLSNASLRIGALARHQTLLDDPVVARHVPLLTEALRHVAHPAIRARGTIGGNLAHADPASELPACMLALSATIEATSARGTRLIDAEAFFTGLFSTALAPDEILTAVTIPLPAPPGTFHEIARRRGDYAIVGLATAGNRYAFFSVGDRPILARHAAAAGPDIATAKAALARDLTPPDDLQATGAMRLHLAGVLLERTLGKS